MVGLWVWVLYVWGFIYKSGGFAWWGNGTVIWWMLV